MQCVVELLPFLVFLGEESDGLAASSPFDVLSQSHVEDQEADNQNNDDTPIPP